MTSRWHNSWSEGRIGFHKSEVHADLIAYADRFLQGGPYRVLVPLCGKTVDLVWLAEQGHEVVGIEFVPQAVDEFFTEQGLVPTERTVDGLRVLRSGQITMVNGDFFAAAPKDFGRFDRIWDRAALVALPEDVRGPYAEALLAFGGSGTLLLQNLFEYDQAKMEGPPFSITDAEFREHYAGSKIELLSEIDSIEKAPQFREKGHEYWIVRNYLVRF